MPPPCRKLARAGVIMLTPLAIGRAWSRFLASPAVIEHPMPQTPPTIAAAVVTHDRLDKLRTTIERLLAEPVSHVVVVDNASSDGTAEWLASLDDPRLMVHRSDSNLGGAGGFSIAMQIARDLSCRASDLPARVSAMSAQAEPVCGLTLVLQRGLEAPAARQKSELLECRRAEA